MHAKPWQLLDGIVYRSFLEMPEICSRIPGKAEVARFAERRRVVRFVGLSGPAVAGQPELACIASVEIGLHLACVLLDGDEAPGETVRHVLKFINPCQGLFVNQPQLALD